MVLFILPISEGNRLGLDVGTLACGIGEILIGLGERPAIGMGDGPRGVRTDTGFGRERGVGTLMIDGPRGVGTDTGFGSERGVGTSMIDGTFGKLYGLNDESSGTDSGEYVNQSDGLIRSCTDVVAKLIPALSHLEATICRVLFHQAQENGVVLFLSDCISSGVGHTEEKVLQEDFVQFVNIVSVIFASSDDTRSG